MSKRADQSGLMTDSSPRRRATFVMTKCVPTPTLYART